MADDIIDGRVNIIYSCGNFFGTQIPGYLNFTNVGTFKVFPLFTVLSDPVNKNQNIDQKMFDFIIQVNKLIQATVIRTENLKSYKHIVDILNQDTIQIELQKQTLLILSILTCWRRGNAMAILDNESLIQLQADVLVPNTPNLYQFYYENKIVFDVTKMSSNIPTQSGKRYLMPNISNRWTDKPAQYKPLNAIIFQYVQKFDSLPGIPRLVAIIKRNDITNRTSYPREALLLNKRCLILINMWRVCNGLRFSIAQSDISRDVLLPEGVRINKNAKNILHGDDTVTISKPFFSTELFRSKYYNGALYQNRDIFWTPVTIAQLKQIPNGALVWIDNWNYNLNKKKPIRSECGMKRDGRVVYMPNSVTGSDAPLAESYTVEGSARLPAHRASNDTSTDQSSGQPHAFNRDTSVAASILSDQLREQKEIDASAVGSQIGQRRDAASEIELENNPYMWWTVPPSLIDPKAGELRPCIICSTLTREITYTPRYVQDYTDIRNKHSYPMCGQTSCLKDFLNLQCYTRNIDNFGFIMKTSTPYDTKLNILLSNHTVEGFLFYKYCNGKSEVQKSNYIQLEDTAHMFIDIYLYSTKHSPVSLNQIIQLNPQFPKAVECVYYIPFVYFKDLQHQLSNIFQENIYSPVLS
jgi:hypothetical protein